MPGIHALHVSTDRHDIDDISNRSDGLPAMPGTTMQLAVLLTRAIGAEAPFRDNRQLTRHVCIETVASFIEAATQSKRTCCGCCALAGETTTACLACVRAKPTALHTCALVACLRFLRTCALRLLRLPYSGRPILKLVKIWIQPALEYCMAEIWPYLSVS